MRTLRRPEQFHGELLDLVELMEESTDIRDFQDRMDGAGNIHMELAHELAALKPGETLDYDKVKATETIRLFPQGLDRPGILPSFPFGHNLDDAFEVAWSRLEAELELTKA